MDVLVVDANLASASAIVSALKRVGIAAQAVESATVAMTMIDSVSLGAVVVDRLVPDMPVEHFLSMMCKRHPELPVVVTADALSEREYAELLCLGASECVLRTEIGSALVTAVKSLTGEASSDPAPPPEVAHRQSPRFAQVLPIAVRVPTWEKFRALYTSNISRGGVFVRCLSPAPVGTVVVLRFGLPDRRIIEIEGEVVHVRPADSTSGRGRRPGMGVRFVRWTEEQRRALAALADRAASLGYGSEPIEIDLLSDSDDPFS